MKKSLLALTACLLSAATLTGQPRYDYDKLQREDLGRGVVAIRKDASTVCLSWRSLSSDPADTGFNIYRNGRQGGSLRGATRKPRQGEPPQTGTIYPPGTCPDRLCEHPSQSSV